MLAIIAIFILEILVEYRICFVTFGYAVNCHEGILLIHPTSEMTQEKGDQVTDLSTSTELRWN